MHAEVAGGKGHSADRNYLSPCARNRTPTWKAPDAEEALAAADLARLRQRFAELASILLDRLRPRLLRVRSLGWLLPVRAPG